MQARRALLAGVFGALAVSLSLAATPGLCADALQPPWEQTSWTGQTQRTYDQVIDESVQKILDARAFEISKDVGWWWPPEVTDFPGPDDPAMAAVIARLCALPREIRVHVQWTGGARQMTEFGKMAVPENDRFFYFPADYKPDARQGCSFAGLVVVEETSTEARFGANVEKLGLDSYFNVPRTDEKWHELHLFTRDDGTLAYLQVMTRRRVIGFPERARNIQLTLRDPEVTTVEFRSCNFVLDYGTGIQR